MKRPGTATVFITHARGFHDYSPAKEYGRLVAITRGRVDTDRLEEVGNNIQDALQRITKDDWLLLDGPPFIAVLCAVHVFNTLGVVNILEWDPVMQEYREHRIDDTYDPPAIPEAR